MADNLLSSPLQGFTDYKFRNTFHTYFGGIDTFYAPYIRLNGKLEIKPAYQRDLLPANNTTVNLIPQVMTNSATEFIFVANYVRSLGYKELNWNLGCPYPMVTKRGMGAGLINEALQIDEILKQVHAETDIVVSMKMRLGFDNASEILRTLPIIDKHPIKNVAIHARLGKQLYKGGVDLVAFQKCVETSNTKLYYNGDITSVKVFEDLKLRFPTIDNWLIGRGILMDPFLPAMIKAKTTKYPENRVVVLSKYHDTLLELYKAALSGDKHLIMKMYHFWEYLSHSFGDSKKFLKKVKKAKNLKIYDAAVKELFLSQN